MDAEVNPGANHHGASGGCGPILPPVSHNLVSLRQQVFEYVRARGHSARADIASALGVSAGSTTTLSAELISAGYLREFESVSKGTGRGRPKVSLEVVPEAACVVGIKLAFNRHTAVLADFSGRVIADVAMTSDTRRRSMNDVLRETEDLIDKLLKKSDKSLRDVRAIGIGLPGILDHLTGSVIWSPLIAGLAKDFSTTLMDKIGLPLLLDNDANMLTLAELWFGEGRFLSDFAVVTVESGVGMGLVLDKQLYRGAHGMGMELGHTKVQLDGALCQCGQRGCLEAYIADYALAREAATALGYGFDSTHQQEDMLATLFEQAKSGHEGAETIFRRAARYLSVGLANVVQLFDPEVIILSGARMKYDYFYADEVMREMEKLTLLRGGRKPCKVAVNAWDDLVWARGASALALTHVTSALIDEARVA